MFQIISQIIIIIHIFIIIFCRYNIKNLLLGYFMKKSYKTLFIGLLLLLVNFKAFAAAPKNIFQEYGDRLPSNTREEPFLVSYDQFYPEDMADIKRRLHLNPETYIELDLSKATNLTEIPERALSSCYGLIRVKLPPTIKRIEKTAFYHCYFLEEIELPASLEYIGDSAFSGCTSLKQVELPQGLTELSYGAFSACYELKEVKLPSTLKEMKSGVFENTGLERIELPEGLTKIEAASFYSCDNLQEVIISSSVNFIGDSAFSYCRALEEIKIPGTVKTICKEAFKICGLKNLILEEGIEKIEGCAFELCPITSVVLPASIQKIYSNIFNDCRELKTIYYRGSKEDWENKYGTEPFYIYNEWDLRFTIISIVFDYKKED